MKFLKYQGRPLTLSKVIRKLSFKNADGVALCLTSRQYLTNLGRYYVSKCINFWDKFHWLADITIIHLFKNQSCVHSMPPFFEDCKNHLSDSASSSSYREGSNAFLSIARKLKHKTIIIVLRDNPFWMPLTNECRIIFFTSYTSLNS